MKYLAATLLFVLFADQPRNAPLRVRGVLLTASWCVPCKQFKREEVARLKRGRWRVGDDPTDHLQILDYESKAAAGYKVNVLPTFLRIVDGKEVGRREKFLDALELAEFVYPTK